MLQLPSPAQQPDLWSVNQHADVNLLSHAAAAWASCMQPMHSGKRSTAQHGIKRIGSCRQPHAHGASNTSRGCDPAATAAALPSPATRVRTSSSATTTALRALFRYREERAPRVFKITSVGCGHPSWDHWNHLCIARSQWSDTAMRMAVSGCMQVTPLAGGTVRSMRGSLYCSTGLGHAFWHIWQHSWHRTWHSIYVQ